jgi:hypothetical protein
MVTFDVLFYPVLAAWIVTNAVGCYLWNRKYIKVAWFLSILNTLMSLYMFVVYVFIGEGVSSIAVFYFALTILNTLIFWYLNIKVHEIWEQERYADLQA